jgi:hypothetical protein
MSNLRARMDALERRLSTAGVKLVMPNGREIRLDADPLVLLRRAIREKAAGQLGETSQLIAQSVLSEEADGSRLIELARALLNSASDESENRFEETETGEIVQ